MALIRNLMQIIQNDWQMSHGYCKGWAKFLLVSILGEIWAKVVAQVMAVSGTPGSTSTKVRWAAFQVAI
jgi:hypothetical protein